MARWAVLCGALIFVLGDVAWAEEPVTTPGPGDDRCVRACRTTGLFRGARWNLKDDPLLSLLDGKVTFNVRLNTFLDLQWFDDDEYVAEGGRQGPQEGGFTINRLRLGFDGTVGKHMSYRFTYELASQGDIEGFAQGNSGIRDLYFDWHRLHESIGRGFPDIRVGAFVVPFGLENTRGHSNITFMTRSIASVFRPGRSEGLMLYDTFAEERIGYQVSLTFNSQVGWNSPSAVVGEVDTSRDGYNVSGRLLWSPTGNERSFTAHFGVSYLHAWGMTASRFRARPENYDADKVIDTDFSTDPASTPVLHDTRSVDIAGGEVMLLCGRWLFQTEGFLCAVQSPAGGNPTFGAGYAYVACLLTGENYRRRGSNLARPEPRSVLDPLRVGRWGHGALEAAVRYSYASLNDGNVRGGTMSNLTLGLNWIWNSMARMQFNFVHSMVNDGVADAPINIFQTRLEIDI